MKDKSSFLLALLILAFCLWKALDIDKLWVQISYWEHFSWILIILWSAPVFFYWIATKESIHHAFNPFLLGLALLFSIAGTIGSLNLFNYLGFACALSAFVPFSLSMFVWLVSSILWMPLTGWALSHIFNFPGVVFSLRFLVLGMSSGWFISTLNSQKE